MRRHYTNYFKGIPNFKDHRMVLVTEKAPELLYARLNEIEAEFQNFNFGDQARA
jgi:hypothetical protein